MSLPLLDTDNYRDANGRLDWDRYKKAEIEHGQSCSKCGQFILWPKGHPQECSECKELEKNAESVRHEELIRCPQCVHQFKAYVDCDDGERLEDGEHNIECPECQAKFQIVTHVSFSFESPAIQKKEPLLSSEDQPHVSSQ